jgi:hypothetical protein
MARRGDLFGLSAEEEGSASTFRACREVFSVHGLRLSLHMDRRSHYFCTTSAGDIDGGACGF